MSRFKNFNIDRKQDKPELRNSESVRDDQTFDRSSQIRRDDDVIKLLEEPFTILTMH